MENLIQKSTMEDVVMIYIEHQQSNFINFKAF